MYRKQVCCIHIVAPDVLHRHVKSISDSAAKNLHFQAPEIDTGLYLRERRGSIIIIIIYFRTKSYYNSC
jgi:hypothetical protein